MIVSIFKQCTKKTYENRRAYGNGFDGWYVGDLDNQRSRNLMAIKKISELPELNDDMAANDLIVIVDASETTQTNKSKKANANKIRIFSITIE